MISLFRIVVKCKSLLRKLERPRTRLRRQRDIKREACACKPGARVKFTTLFGGTQHGVVIDYERGIASVYVDRTYRETETVWGSIEPSNKPTHKEPPTVMDDYEVKNYSGSSSAFTAVVCRKGEPILKIYSVGTREKDNRYKLLRSRQEDRELYERDLRDWAYYFGYNVIPEEKYLLSRTWITWKHSWHPFGAPAEVELENTFGDDGILSRLKEEKVKEEKAKEVSCSCQSSIPGYFDEFFAPISGADEARG